jgi:hypothetical protein
VPQLRLGGSSRPLRTQHTRLEQLREALPAGPLEPAAQPAPTSTTFRAASCRVNAWLSSARRARRAPAVPAGAWPMSPRSWSISAPVQGAVNGERMLDGNRIVALLGKSSDSGEVQDLLSRLGAKQPKAQERRRGRLRRPRQAGSGPHVFRRGLRREAARPGDRRREAVADNSPVQGRRAPEDRGLRHDLMGLDTAVEPACKVRCAMPPSSHAGRSWTRW